MSSDLETLITEHLDTIAETTWALRNAAPASAGLDLGGRILLCLRNHDGSGYVDLAMGNDLSQHAKLLLEAPRLDAEKAVHDFFDLILRIAPVLDAPSFSLSMMISTGQRRAIQFSLNVVLNGITKPIAHTFSPKRRCAERATIMLRNLSSLPAWNGQPSLHVKFFNHTYTVAAANLETAEAFLKIFDEHDS